MSTRCQVVKQLDKDTYKGIYIHFDGYIKGGVGEILYRYYTNEKLVDQLLELGDLSSLGECPQSDAHYWNRYDNPENLSDFIPHKDSCVAYKDRKGEENWEAKVGSLEDFLCDEYCYVWKDNEWYLCTYDNKEGTRLVKYFK